MIKFEHTEVVGWEAAIRGMRNPKNSWDKSDSVFIDDEGDYHNIIGDMWPSYNEKGEFLIGPNDLDLMKRLRNAGTDHRKYLRMIVVYVDITAPLYWWKEFDTYKVGTVANSCSTMHKIAAKEFTLDDFSTEHLFSSDDVLESDDGFAAISVDGYTCNYSPKYFIQMTCDMLNYYRKLYLKTKDKRYWWQMIQLLPSSYNQKRTVMMCYEVLANIYKSRKNHKQDEWKEHEESTCSVNINGDCKNTKEYLLCEYCSVGKGLCDWIKTLPYSELITGPALSDIPIMEEAKRRTFEELSIPIDAGIKLSGNIIKATRDINKID